MGVTLMGIIINLIALILSYLCLFTDEHTLVNVDIGLTKRGQKLDPKTRHHMLKNLEAKLAVKIKRKRNHAIAIDISSISLAVVLIVLYCVFLPTYFPFIIVNAVLLILISIYFDCKRAKHRKTKNMER